MNKEYNELFTEDLFFCLSLAISIQNESNIELAKLQYLYGKNYFLERVGYKAIKHYWNYGDWFKIYEDLKKRLAFFQNKSNKLSVDLKLSCAIMEGPLDLLGHCLDINAIENSCKLSGVYTFYLDYPYYLPEETSATVIVLHHEDFIYVFPDFEDIYYDDYQFIKYPKEVYLKAVAQLKNSLLEFKKETFNWQTVSDQFNESEQIKWLPYFNPEQRNL